MARIALAHDVFPIRGSFTIARGARTESHVVRATLTEGDHVGQGEATPYPRYGETVGGVMADLAKLADAISAGMTRAELQEALPGGAARNALDCAFWDLEAKRAGSTVAALTGIAAGPLTTAYTISLGDPAVMAAATAEAAHRPLLKIKLGMAEGDPARIAAVRAAAPDATLIVDANEGWHAANLAENVAACDAAGVALIEQPLPAADDAALADVPSNALYCADESVHTRADLPRLRERYQAVNVKLDKTGGLTEALATVADARALEFSVMVGCMLGSSLAMSPAMFAAQGADFVDLDAPLLLAADRNPGLTYEGSTVHPPVAALWG